MTTFTRRYGNFSFYFVLKSNFSTLKMYKEVISCSTYSNKLKVGSPQKNLKGLNYKEFLSFFVHNQLLLLKNFSLFFTGVSPNFLIAYAVKYSRTINISYSSELHLCFFCCNHIASYDNGHLFNLDLPLLVFD